jgi:predicted TIM-barrel fold metal-dependent hydrolase
MEIDRRTFTKLLLAAPALALPGCTDDERYTEEDAARLDAQWLEEAARSGKGPYGPQRYRGYRGLAELPYFELDDRGTLRCTVEDLPPIFDVHAHLGMALLLAPNIDLLARTERVRYMLDCDSEDPGCALDLDVYMNANFTPEALRGLRMQVLGQFVWGSGAAATQTIPNLLDEMDAVGVQRALILPIAFGVPFRDRLTESWMGASSSAEVGDRLVPGASVHPRDSDRIDKLRRYAKEGARAVKMHPAAQRFYPDAPEAMEIYQECGRLGLVVVFHAGRAGIEPESSHPYTLMRNYEPMLREFPHVQFVFGHAGARDVADAIPLARRYPNAWLGIHGQGVTTLHELIESLGTERLLFGTDWPFYPLAPTLAKVLMVTQDRPDARRAILRGNADRLFGTASTKSS